MVIVWDEAKLLLAVLKTSTLDKPTLLQECQKTIDKDINAKALENKLYRMKQMWEAAETEKSPTKSEASPVKPVKARPGANKKGIARPIKKARKRPRSETVSETETEESPIKKRVIARGKAKLEQTDDDDGNDGNDGGNGDNCDHDDDATIKGESE